MTACKLKRRVTQCAAPMYICDEQPTAGLPLVAPQPLVSPACCELRWASHVQLMLAIYAVQPLGAHGCRAKGLSSKFVRGEIMHAQRTSGTSKQ